MNRDQELELRLRTAFVAGALPPAPTSLHDALGGVVGLPVETRGRRAGLGIIRALAVAAVVAVGGAVALSVGSGRFDAPPSETVLTPSSPPSESGEPVLRLTFQPQWTAAVPATSNRLDAIVDTLGARLDALGFESAVASDDNGNVVLEVPDDVDAETVRRVVNQVGYVEFVPLGDRSAVSGERLDGAEYPALFDGEAVTSATMTEDQSGLPSIEMTLRDAEATRFGDYTAANIGSFFAITIDRVVVLAPSINEAIHGGELAISPGGPDTERFVEVAAIIDNGPLPVRLVEVTAETPVPDPSPGYELVCGPMERSACEARAAGMVAGIRDESPSKTVVLVEFLAGGDTRVVFDDGTEVLGIRD